MAPAGNTTKGLSLVKHSPKTISTYQISLRIKLVQFAAD